MKKYWRYYAEDEPRTFATEEAAEEAMEADNANDPENAVFRYIRYIEREAGTEDEQG